MPYPSHYVNANRTNEERRARYCFLTKCMGLSRDVTRGIVGRSDAKIALTLESMDKVNKHYDGYVESHIQAVKQSKKEIIECEA